MMHKGKLEFELVTLNEFQKKAPWLITDSSPPVWLECKSRSPQGAAGERSDRLFREDQFAIASDAQSIVLTRMFNRNLSMTSHQFTHVDLRARITVQIT
jgi:hypothetical protein